MSCKWLICLLAHIAFKAAALDPVGCGSGQPKPLLWRFSSGQGHGYMLASHRVATDQVQPIPSATIQAIGCADIAYFNYACTPGVQGGLGSYIQHCDEYAIADYPRDTIATRLPQERIQKLQDALVQLAADAPITCSAVADRLRTTSAALSSTYFKKTLRWVFRLARKVVDPTRCTVTSRTGGADEATGGGFEGWVREQFSTARPTFGLEDIAEKCKIARGGFVEDVHLTDLMINRFGNSTLVADERKALRSLGHALACGDLGRLTAMSDYIQVPFLSKRNPDLAKRIEWALRDNPDKSLMVVLNVGHFIDGPDGKLSLPGVMAEKGFQIERISQATLDCKASTYVAPGTRELGTCLRPADRKQPTSCTNFMKEVEQTLLGEGRDSRTRVDVNDNCRKCEKASASCSCNLQWANTSHFNRLCQDLVVDGVPGQVLQLDLVRNPGSVHSGADLSEKQIVNERQNCYAVSCDRQLLREMAERNWYKADPELNTGIVNLTEITAAPNVGFPWLWYAGAAGALVLLATMLFIPYHSRDETRRIGDGEGDMRVTFQNPGVHSIDEVRYDTPIEPPFPVPADQLKLQPQPGWIPFPRPAVPGQFPNAAPAQPFGTVHQMHPQQGGQSLNSQWPTAIASTHPASPVYFPTGIGAPQVAQVPTTPFDSVIVTPRQMYEPLPSSVNQASAMPPTAGFGFQR